jgi:hypothetical protein
MNVYVGGWSLKPERDNQASTPVAGSLRDGVLDLRFEPSGQRVKPFTVTPGSLEPMNLASLGDGYRCHTRLRDYWLKASPGLDGFAGTQKPES